VSLANPHDRFFKQAFGQPEAARDFLLHYLPAKVVAVLDVDRPEPIPATFVDAELREHFADLVYRVRRRDGGPAWVYVLFEHKSAPEPLTPLQVLRYQVRGWEYQLKEGEALCPILPVVVYHGAETWTVGECFLDLFGLDATDPLAAYQPDFRYHLCDLSRYSDDELRGGVMLHAALLTMKYIFRDELHDRLPGILALTAELLDRETGLQYVETLLRYLTAGTDQLGAQELMQAVAQALPEEGGTLMPTIAEQWIQEGERRGMQRGREEGERRGLERGRLDGLALALELRFGEPGLRLLPEIEQRADAGTLQALMEALRRVTSPEELRQVYAAP